MSEKYPKWEGREERANILGRELVLRGINPHYLTVDEYKLVFGFNNQNHDGEEQRMRACRNLLQRSMAKHQDFAYA